MKLTVITYISAHRITPSNDGKCLAKHQDKTDVESLVSVYAKISNNSQNTHFYSNCSVLGEY